MTSVGRRFLLCTSTRYEELGLVVLLPVRGAGALGQCFLSCVVTLETDLCSSIIGLLSVSAGSN